MAKSTPIWRLIGVATIIFTLAVFLFINGLDEQASLFYSSIILFSIGVAVLFVLYNRSSSYGIQPGIIKHVILGLMVGFGFIIGNILQPGVITLGTEGVFSAISSEQSRFLIVAILAPGAEEFFFTQVILGLVLLRRFGFLIASSLKSTLFALFHLVAYAAAPQAFIGAFIFSFLAAWLYYKTGDFVAPAIAHAVVNTFLIVSPFVVVGSI